MENYRNYIFFAKIFGFIEVLFLVMAIVQGNVIENALDVLLSIEYSHEEDDGEDRDPLKPIKQKSRQKGAQSKISARPSFFQNKKIVDFCAREHHRGVQSLEEPTPET